MEFADRQSGASGLLPQDRREIQAAAEYAGINEKQLIELSANFSKRGRLRLFWDRKVPSEDRRLWYFFTFGSSNKTDVLAEIKKYLDFYTGMGEVAQTIENPEERKAQEVNKLAVKLLNHLKELYRAAERGIDTTSSKTVYELHRQMVRKHEKLEMKVMQMEYISRYEVEKEKTEKLEQQLKESRAMHLDVCSKFKVVIDKNEGLRNGQSDLEAKNEKLVRENRSHREEKNGKERQLLLLEHQNEELKENNKRQLLLQEKLNEEYREQKTGIERQLLLLEEQNEELRENNKRQLLFQEQEKEEFREQRTRNEQQLLLLGEQNEELRENNKRQLLLLEKLNEEFREQKTRKEHQLLLLEKQNEELRENNRRQLLLQEQQNEELKEQKAKSELQLLLLEKQNEELREQRQLILKESNESGSTFYKF